MKKKTFVLVALLAFFANSYAYVPPVMGWSSWNAFHINISDKLIVQQAQYMSKLGLQKAGYNYINIDDGFFGGRDTSGNLYTHPTRFPKGLKWVIDSLHAMGFKAGIYSDAGSNTCGSMWDGAKNGVGVGLYQHDQQDCNMFFKDLGYDFFKVDYCGGQKLGLDEKTRYTEIVEAIKKTGRNDVIFNVCRWSFPGTWAHDIAASWRISGDINLTNYWSSMSGIIGANLYLSAYATEGHYNDMDMLEAGRGMDSIAENTHVGMWCIMASPLLIGCDMSTVPARSIRLMCNPELIAINQDTLCLQAPVVRKDNGAYILAKDLERRYGKTRVFAVYNPSSAAVTTTINFGSDILLKGNIKVRDLFQRKDTTTTTDSTFAITVPSHGTAIYKVTGNERLEQTAYEAETAWLDKFQLISSNSFARYSDNSNASGGKVVGWLGNGAANYMEWRNVFSQTGGDYQLTVKYLMSETRNVMVTVNGTDSTTISAPSTGGKIGGKTINIKLKPGVNKIRLSNATGWAPDIDGIELKCVKPLTTSINKVKSITATLGTKFMLNDTNAIEISTSKDVVAGIWNGSGQKIRDILLKSGNNTISNLSAGVYIIKAQE